MKNKNGIFGAIVVIVAVVLIAYIYSGDKEGITTKNTTEDVVAENMRGTMAEGEADTTEEIMKEDETEAIEEIIDVTTTEVTEETTTEEATEEPSKEKKYYVNNTFYYKMIIPDALDIIQQYDMGEGGIMYMDATGATLTIDGGWNEGKTPASIEEEAYNYGGVIIRGRGDWYCCYTFMEGDWVYMRGYFVSSDVLVSYEFTYASYCYEDRFESIITQLEDCIKTENVVFR